VKDYGKVGPVKTTAILQLNDYFTKLSLLVSFSQWRGSGKERVHFFAWKQAVQNCYQEDKGIK